MACVVFNMTTLNHLNTFIFPSGTYINDGYVNLEIVVSHFFYRHIIVQRHIIIAAIFNGELEGCVMKAL